MPKPLEDDCERLDMRNRLMMIRACFADALADAESYLHVLDVTHPEDDRPRKAIAVARTIDDAIERYLDGQIEWIEVGVHIEALEQAADEVSMYTVYNAKTELAFSATDAVCHAIRTISNAGQSDTVNAIRDAACAAGAIAVCRRVDGSEEKLSERAIRAVMDEAYDAKIAELHQAVAELLASQA